MRLTIAFTLLLCAACGPQQRATTAAHTYGSDADPLFFSLERTPCFGKCPAYLIAVDREGAAVYTGRTFADRPGTWKARVDRATMAALLERADAIGFFALEDRYDGSVTDVPSTIIRVNADGRDKKVVARYKVPPAFKAFAAHADSLLDRVDWERVPAQE